MNENTVKTQQVLGALRTAGFTMGRRLSSSLGWVAQAVSNKNYPALTIEGRVHTPAEAVRISYNFRDYKFARANCELQTPAVIECLTAKGWVVEKTGNYEWVVRAA